MVSLTGDLYTGHGTKSKQKGGYVSYWDCMGNFTVVSADRGMWLFFVYTIDH